MAVNGRIGFDTWLLMGGLGFVLAPVVYCQA